MQKLRIEEPFYSKFFEAALAVPLSILLLMIYNPLAALPIRYSQKITDQSELDLMVAQEAKRLGIKENVIAIYHEGDGHAEAYASVNDEGMRQVDIGKSVAARTVVAHEMYHHYKGHENHPHNNLANMLDFTFRRQPQAILYQYWLIYRKLIKRENIEI